MQVVNLEEFPNSAEWAVHHDIDNQMYTLRNAKGNKLSGSYTSRRMAEVALYQYLSNIASKPSKGRTPDTKKAPAKKVANS